MKVISLTISSIDEIRSIHHVEQIDLLSRLEDLFSLKGKYDAILLEQKLITLSDLIEIREKFKNQKIVIISNYINDSFRRICIANNIDLYTEALDITLKQFIEKKWFNIEENKFKNVISFSGTHPRVGVTQTIFGLATIAASLNLRILVIGANLYNGHAPNHKRSEQSFDTLYPLLEKQLLTKDNLKDYVISLNNFDYLVGNLDFYKTVEFESKPCEYLISFIAEQKLYDYVFIDVGSYYDSLVPLTFLNISHLHFLLTTQEVISKKNYERWKLQILDKYGLDHSKTSLIVNKYVSSAVITLNMLEKEFNLPLLGHVPLIAEATDIEFEVDIILDHAAKPYINSLEKLAKGILEKEVQMKKKSLNIFSFLG